jgi:glutathione S-transferase
MITLYGHPMSTCTRKVLMTLAETETAYEMRVIDFATAEHKKPAHVSRQPFGRVPAIEDGGFEMFESRAIARYVNDKAHGKLVPADVRAHAKMEQWISIETSEFSAQAMKFIYEHVFKRPQEAAVLEAASKAVETVLGVLEKQLAATPYLAGADFSLADVMYMPYFEYCMLTPAKEIFARYPRVMAWWNQIGARPTWQKVAGKA